MSSSQRSSLTTCCAVLAGDGDVVVGAHGHLGQVGLQAGAFHRGLDLLERVRAR